MIFRFYLSIAITLFLVSCSSSTEKYTSKNSDAKQKQVRVNIVSPSRQTEYKIGDLVAISFNLTDSVQFDSIGLSVNNGDNIFFDSKQAVEWKSDSAKTGLNQLRLTVYVDTLKYYGSTTVHLLAAHPPKQMTYKIIKSYKHDPKAYTQGLIYEEGFLYESTGQHGESSLRKVNLANGEILQIYDLATQDFGEGIARVKDKIYMLTWETRKGYVFDIKTFKLDFEFPLSTEGWGLTFDGEYLIRSDGSNLLYFIHPEYFTEVGTLEVYDHERKITRLNELEYYDGKIWANVYGEDYIVTINPKNGAVIEKIDFEGLLTEADKKEYRVDVLNGIAWNKQTDQLFITGKLWPKLFEVSLIEK